MRHIIIGLLLWFLLVISCATTPDVVQSHITKPTAAQIEIFKKSILPVIKEAYTSDMKMFISAKFNRVELYPGGYEYHVTGEFIVTSPNQICTYTENAIFRVPKGWKRFSLIGGLGVYQIGCIEGKAA